MIRLFRSYRSIVPTSLYSVFSRAWYYPPFYLYYLSSISILYRVGDDMNDTNESRRGTATFGYVLSYPNERIERTERMSRHPPADAHHHAAVEGIFRKALDPAARCGVLPSGRGYRPIRSKGRPTVASPPAFHAVTWKAGPPSPQVLPDAHAPP